MKSRAIFAAITLVTALSLASPASARVEFAAYEGRDAVRTGEGGTRITAHGVDFWTNGDPPRRYQILGMLTDERSNRLWDGRAVGSRGLAERVLAVGGNALIMADRERETTGGVFSGGVLGNGLFGSTRRRVTTTTSFLVVRYLEDEPAQAAAASPVDQAAPAPAGEAMQNAPQATAPAEAKPQ